jgi:hypothetical protein
MPRRRSYGKFVVEITAGDFAFAAGHLRATAYRAPYLGFEFLSGLLDSSLLVWCFDDAEPYGLLGDLVNVPARRLRWFRSLGHDYRPGARCVQIG